MKFNFTIYDLKKVIWESFTKFKMNSVSNKYGPYSLFSWLIVYIIVTSMTYLYEVAMLAEEDWSIYNNLLYKLNITVTALFDNSIYCIIWKLNNLTFHIKCFVKITRHLTC
jgi:hypothetical protein